MAEMANQKMSLFSFNPMKKMNMNACNRQSTADQRRIHGVITTVSLAAALLLFGCAHLGDSDEPDGSGTPPAESGLSRPVPRSDFGEAPTEAQSLLARAEAFYEEGAYAEALQLCIEVTQLDRNTPGLESLRNRVLSAKMDQRALEATARDELDHRRVARDAAERGHIPDTYGLRRMVEEGRQDRLSPDSPILRSLQRPVSIHLEGADLSALIQAISEDEEINMIADEGIGEGRKIDIHVTDTPLREVFDYISRQFGVQFHTGENMIWVTSAAPEQGSPMQTRVYRLRTGLQFQGHGWGELTEGERTTQSDISNLSRKATVLPSQVSYLEEIIEKFVPTENGAALHVDYNTHTLFARNTPEHLGLISDIVEALDVNPPQVLIEARFIEISHADLREIGIDWILGSPLSLSTTGVTANGVRTRQPQTVIEEGGSISYIPYRSDDAGSFPLGPQGAFGSTRTGNPPTADQGLNLTFSGVLTEPMFSAVLHALEISGKGRTLSVPRVTTINNNPAKLRDGDDLLYYEEFEAQAFHMLDRSGDRVQVTALIPKGTPSMAELGFTLVAVPSVGSDNRSISLLLTPTISELKEFISYQEDRPEEEEEQRIRQVVVKLPRISRREVQTKVVVDSGETVVMGGLIRTVSQDTEHRVPFLGSLPLVGQLFRRSDVTDERRNLIIFVTATVISERGESLIPLTRRDGDSTPSG